jgi:hypothetical protein
VKLTLAAVLLLTGGMVVGMALASTPTLAAWAMVLALLPGAALCFLWQRWFRAWDAARRRQGWREWTEYRSALKKDEARRKRIRSQRQ